MSSGYSGTPLPQKLGIKPDSRLGLLNAPEDFMVTLGELPRGVRVLVGRLQPPVDVIVAFFAERRQLERRLPGLIGALDPAGGLWIAWPKRASKVETDITEDVVREVALAERVVDNKVCAIDDVWSGLRLVIRVRDR
ncbi:MAG: hypothetical protein JWN32_1680 [Solirubrobacterales bacterium]|nr:hypothetical protein [Solirubrobacterales bacterium]